MIASAGDKQVKLWDVVGGYRCLDTLQHHQKTVTSMCYDVNRQRLFTASLDHHVKIIDTTTLKPIHNIKYLGPILCVGISVRLYLLNVAHKTAQYNSFGHWNE